MELHPETGRALETYTRGVASRPPEEPRIRLLLGYLEQLVSPRRILVAGCGPRPDAVRVLRELGYDAVGMEPVAGFADAARAYLGDDAAVVEGAAERLPVRDGAYDAVLLESVLEHVESPMLSLAEVWRVLAPGGVALVITTNRHRMRQGEFNRPCFQWYPASVKESYVHRHLHHDPSLANYTERPAVHWFTFAHLCRIGRNAGFARFYSHLDLKDEAAMTGWKLLALRSIRWSPWLRALALTQVGGMVFMVKRPT